MSVEIFSENPIVNAVISGSAPRQASLAAARGALPLAQNDLLEILVFLANSKDSELSAAAKETLNALDVKTLHAAIETSDVAPTVLAYLTGRRDLSREVYEQIVRHPKTPDSSLLKIAINIRDSNLLDVIAFNQQRLIRMPALIDAILANPSRTPEAERRVTETKKEFFEKERGAAQIAEELRAQGLAAAAEFIEEVEIVEEEESSSGLTFDDAVFLAQFMEVPDEEIDDTWLGLDYLEEIYAETEEQRQAIVKKIIGDLDDDDESSGEKISLAKKLMKASMKKRVKYAMKGNREVRTILVRDPNKIVAQAVVNNPRITEQEVEKIAAMRTVPGEVLRLVAINRTWARNYTITCGLAKNPRTPLANAMSILPRIMTKDLKGIVGNRNVSEAIRRQAGRLLESRPH